MDAVAERHDGLRALVLGGGSSANADDVASRIGASIAVRLAAEGAVVAVVDIDRDRAEATVKASAGEGFAIVADLGDADACERTVAEAEAGLGALDAIILAVGIPSGHPLRRQEVDDWDRAMAVNARAHFLAIKHSLPGMLERGGGSFVGISSVAALRSEGRSLSYEASKAAQLAVLRHTAVRYADRGIRANSVVIGYFDTAMAASAGNASSWRAAASPVAHQGRAADAAAVVSHLLCADMAYINGAEIPVDGGVLAQGVERLCRRIEESR